MSKTSTNGTVSLPNPHLKDLGRDYLYHIGLTTDDNLEERFGDVKVNFFFIFYILQTWNLF